MKKLIILLLLLCLVAAASAEDEMFILCRPTTEINVRLSPKFGAEIIGHLYLGSVVHPDGKKKNGFVHVVDLGFECMEGWIYGGLLVSTPPEAREQRMQIQANGRVAARQYINGKRNKWLRSGKEVVVYAISQEWSITDCGYIQTEFLCQVP